VPGLGVISYQDKARLLRRYLEAGAEACEITVKRDGADYYACVSVRGLRAASQHPHSGSAVGLDMGVANPLASSDGELITHHQRHAIKEHLARLERKKRRVKRDYARKLRAAAARAGALTETGAFKKGVPIAASSRMRRLNERYAGISREPID
jgi:transposase